MKLQAVNQVIIVKKDHGETKSYGGIILPQQDIKDYGEIPPPYSGVIDSIGYETDEFHIGDHIHFEDISGLYIEFDGHEYAVIAPEGIVCIEKKSEE